MSIDAQQEHGEKVRKDLNVYTRSLSVVQDRQILTCSRSGDRELQGPVSRRRGDCGGQAPALRGRSSLSVGQDRQILTRSRSGDRELQGPWPLFSSAGSPDPARTAKQNPVNLENPENPASASGP